MKVVTLDSIVAVIRARRGYKGFLYKFIEECEIVDAIPIPDGATNGDMIKAMFPNAKTWEVTRDDIHCAYIEFKDICEIKSFPLSWWNAPYQKEVEE